ncbi:MAG: molecular chaperone TorD family protein [Hyphomicrobiales bacterium]|nr:molecular chaperone TorD family protein [Hyphomicrobiales bacterium]MCP5371815.1 molecular chaperone TorD family protein [Hyphomicrobiales bacterium]
MRHSSGDHPQGEVGAEDVGRARLYALLARLLASPPASDVLETLTRLQGDGTEIGQALAELARCAADTGADRAEDEYTVLFYGQGAGGELLPYASHYQTGLLYDQPLAALRGDLADLGIAPASTGGEPEDHIAFVCDAMAGLIEGRFGAPPPLAAQQAFFDAHLAPWAADFFTDLESTQASPLYAAVGRLGRVFVAIEAEAFKMAA